MSGEFKKQVSFRMKTQVERVKIDIPEEEINSAASPVAGISLCKYGSFYSQVDNVEMKDTIKPQ